MGNCYSNWFKMYLGKNLLKCVHKKCWSNNSDILEEQCGDLSRMIDATSDDTLWFGIWMGLRIEIQHKINLI